MDAIGDVLGRMAARQRLTGDVSDGRACVPHGGTLTTDDGPRADPACAVCGGRGVVQVPSQMVYMEPRRNPQTGRDEWTPKTVLYTQACGCMLRPMLVVRSAEACGLSGKLAGYRLDDVSPARSRLAAADWARVQTWADGIPDSLAGTPGWLFTGPPGTGKTHLQAALLHRARLCGVRVRLVEETAIVTDIQATYHPDSDQSEADIIADLQRVPVLAIDDLGKAYVPGRQSPQDGSAWLASRLYAVLNKRLVEGRPTLLSTNLGDEQLTRRLGDALMDRVDTLGLLEFSGKSQR
jgi:hypothetical protein